MAADSEAGSADSVKEIEKRVLAYHASGRVQEALAMFRSEVVERAPSTLPGFDADYLDGLAATGSNPVPIRRRARFEHLVRLLRATPRDSGYVAECGCFRGLSTFLICRTLGAERPDFDGGGMLVFDSFQGLGDPTEDDDVPDSWPNAAVVRQMSTPGAFAASLSTVRQHLRAFPAIEFHPGWIPLTFTGLTERRYRFVHVDVDLYDPTRDCLEYFYPRLAPGGRIVSDDYAAWPGARLALDEFARERSITLELPPSGQAVITRQA